LSINWLGVAIAGMMNGSFAVPMKRARAWKFEHVWGVFSLLAMVVIPWCAVLLAVPGWHDILASVSGRALGSVIVLGLLWGVSALLYGLAIYLLGIALGFAIQLGLSIVAGSLIPFALVRGFSMRTPSDVAFLMGVALMVAGVRRPWLALVEFWHSVRHISAAAWSPRCKLRPMGCLECFPFRRCCFAVRVLSLPHNSLQANAAILRRWLEP